MDTPSNKDLPPFRLSIGHLIYLLNLHKERLLEKYLEDFPITSAQFKVMRLIEFEGLETPCNLARALSCDSGAMTRMLDRLEQQKLIVRRRSQQDRRQVRLQMTAEGKEINQKAHSVVSHVIGELTENLSDDEQSQLEQLIHKILEPTGLMDSLEKVQTSRN